MQSMSLVPRVSPSPKQARRASTRTPRRRFAKMLYSRSELDTTLHEKNSTYPNSTPPTSKKTNENSVGFSMEVDSSTPKRAPTKTSRTVHPGFRRHAQAGQSRRGLRADRILLDSSMVRASKGCNMSCPWDLERRSSGFGFAVALCLHRL